jgi:hypothetical protein
MRLNCWKIKPIFWFLIMVAFSRLSWLTSSPSKNIFHVVGKSSKPIIDNKVDFPQPEGPEIEIYSPC